MRIPESELILNNDGSIYHLHLLPEDIADIILTVGDPERVPHVSCYFDSIEMRKQKREFVTHTGYVGSKRITVMSTGMSTDNIDIVINELDAIANINLETREPKPANEIKSLKIIRVGTSGGLQKDIPLDSFVVSDIALGLDGLSYFYPINFNAQEKVLQDKFINAFQPDIKTAYAIEGDKKLVELFHEENFIPGRTVTCAGFYGPQGRSLRAKPSIEGFAERLTQFGLTNFEMETAGIYAMGRLLGHQCCSVSAIVADRVTGKFSKQASKTIDLMIQSVLSVL
jgi:uridine phosphorylase